MKFNSLLFCLWIATGLTGHSQTNPFFTVKGKEILGPGGMPFLIRGTNLGNWLVPEGYMFKFKRSSSPRLINQVLNELIGPDESRAFWNNYLDNYITESDIHYIKSIGMNSIRVPFNYRLFTEEDYLGGRGERRGFALVDRLVSWCKKENLYIILDMHCAPGGQTGDNIDDGYGYPFLFDKKESQEETVRIWQKIAQHYADENTIMGFDLLNEPIAHYFDSSHFNALLEPLYKKIVAAIRSVDQHHLVFLGGAQWDSNFKIFGPPFDNKAVYTFHKYWTATTQEVIQDYIDFRERFQVPIYAGETGENKDQWILEFRKLLELNNIGWHFWPYKKINNTSGIITFSIPEYYNQVIEYADTARIDFQAIRKFRPKNIEQVKKALNGFLQNCQFKNCNPNRGYIEALGLDPGK